jgi:L-aminopeptidase/D-esterase-like protein
MEGGVGTAACKSNTGISAASSVAVLAIADVAAPVEAACVASSA